MSVDKDVVVVEVEGGISDNITILLLIRKEKLCFTTRSGIIMSLDKKMEKVQRKNSRLLKTHVIDVVWKDTGRTCRTAKHLVDMYQALVKEKRKKIEINFTDSNGMDLSYFDNDFLIGPSENFDYLMDDLMTMLNKYMYFILECILF